MPELNALQFERLITFVKIDFTPFGDEVRRYVDTSTYAGDTPELGHVTWMEEEWLATAFQAGGFSRGGENLVQPSIVIGDFTGGLYNLLRELDHAPGAHITIYSAFADDVENEVPNCYFRQEEYVLSRAKRSNMNLELELATHIEFARRKAPGFKMMREDYPGLGSALLRG